MASPTRSGLSRRACCKEGMVVHQPMPLKMTSSPLPSTIMVGLPFWAFVVKIAFESPATAPVEGVAKSLMSTSGTVTAAGAVVGAAAVVAELDDAKTGLVNVWLKAPAGKTGVRSAGTDRYCYSLFVGAFKGAGLCFKPVTPWIPNWRYHTVHAAYPLKKLWTAIWGPFGVSQAAYPEAGGVCWKAPVGVKPCFCPWNPWTTSLWLGHKVFLQGLSITKTISCWDYEEWEAQRLYKL